MFGWASFVREIITASGKVTFPFRSTANQHTERTSLALNVNQTCPWGLRHVPQKDILQNFLHSWFPHGNWMRRIPMAWTSLRVMFPEHVNTETRTPASNGTNAANLVHLVLLYTKSLQEKRLQYWAKWTYWRRTLSHQYYSQLFSHLLSRGSYPLIKYTCFFHKWFSTMRRALVHSHDFLRRNALTATRKAHCVWKPALIRSRVPAQWGRICCE